MNLQQKANMWRFALHLAQYGGTFVLPDDDPRYAALNPDKWCEITFGPAANGANLSSTLPLVYSQTRWGQFEHPDGIGFWFRDLEDIETFKTHWPLAESIV